MGHQAWRGRRRLGAAPGLTLAELAMALALFALLLVGILALWSRAQEAYLVGVASAELLDNLRAAVDFMTRELRAAGRDLTLCAFDYERAGGTRDCDPARVGACQEALGSSYGASNGLPDGGPGCMGLSAIPYRDATGETIRVRSDRNANGRIAGRSNAVVTGAGADRAEEDVRYALSRGTSCPPGIARCLTRDDGNGSIALLAVEITRFELTYFPRPGFGPCAGVGQPPLVPTPCPPVGLPLTSQAEADDIARVRISLTGRLMAAGQPISRALATDVALENRR